MLSAIKKIGDHAERVYLDTLYRIYFSMLYDLANQILNDKDSENEAVTTAMLSLFSLVPKLRAMSETQCVAYLRKTVRRAAYKYYKAHKRQSLTELPLGEDLLFSLPDQRAGPDALVLQSEDFRAVHEAIATLPKRDRELLYLRYATELTAKEITELTAAPSVAAVHERLSRARRKVLVRLQERGWTDEAGYDCEGTPGAVRG